MNEKQSETVGLVVSVAVSFAIMLFLLPPSIGGRAPQDAPTPLAAWVWEMVAPLGTLASHASFAIYVLLSVGVTSVIVLVLRRVTHAVSAWRRK